MCVVGREGEWNRGRGRHFVCRLVGSHKGEFKFDISGYSHFHLFATHKHTHREHTHTEQSPAHTHSH